MTVSTLSPQKTQTQILCLSVYSACLMTKEERCFQCDPLQRKLESSHSLECDLVGKQCAIPLSVKKNSLHDAFSNLSIIKEKCLVNYVPLTTF